MIPSLLQEGVNTNVLLNLFCKTKNLIGIEYMLSFSHIDVNTPYKNLSPLEYCINNKNGYACVLLLKNDYINFQTIDSKSANDETILHTSCLYGLSKPVSFLLRKHLYDVNLPTKDGVCPIHYACLSGDYDTVLAVIRTKKLIFEQKLKMESTRKEQHYILLVVLEIHKLLHCYLILMKSLKLMMLMLKIEHQLFMQLKAILLTVFMFC